MLMGSMAFLFVGFYDIGYFLKWVRNFLPVLSSAVCDDAISPSCSFSIYRFCHSISSKNIYE
jgi:hypothetical protein